MSDFLRRICWGCAWGSKNMVLDVLDFLEVVLVDFAWQLPLGGPDCLERSLVGQNPKTYVFFEGHFAADLVVPSKYILKNHIQGFRSEFGGGCFMNVPCILPAKKCPPPQLKLTVLVPPERHALLHLRCGRIFTWFSHDSHLLLTLHLFSTLFSPFLLILTFFLTICSPSYQLIPTFSADSHLMFNLFSPHRILTLYYLILTLFSPFLSLFWPCSRLTFTFFSSFFLPFFSPYVHVIIPLFWPDFSVILTLSLPSVHLFPTLFSPSSHRILPVCFADSDLILTLILTLFSHFPQLILTLLSPYSLFSLTLCSPFPRLFSWDWRWNVGAFSFSAFWFCSHPFFSFIARVAKPCRSTLWSCDRWRRRLEILGLSGGPHLVATCERNENWCLLVKNRLRSFFSFWILKLMYAVCMIRF